MSTKATNIVCYIGWIGWLIAFLAGDKEGAKFHLNQGLVLVIVNIASGILAFVPVIGTIVACVVSVAVLVFAIMGIVYAAQEQEKELPLIGKIKILK